MPDLVSGSRIMRISPGCVVISERLLDLTAIPFDLSGC